MTRPGPAIRVLGSLSIDRTGAAGPTAFPGRRSELVFAYLAVEHHRDVSRDELAEALWPQGLPDAWAAALRGVISDLRRVIEAAGLDPSDVVERTGTGYRLRLPDDAVLDLDEARAALAGARAHLERAPVAAATGAARAAELARLPFLPRYEGDWVDGIRRELDGIVVEALELGARAHARAGDARAASTAAAHLVEVEPYSEAAHRLRIEILVAAGDRAGALRAYEQCRSTLVRELGVEPSAETQAALQPALAPPVPAVGEDAAAPAAAASALAALSVLVVDDHGFQRRTALALLGRLGVGSLAEASDGAEALELLADSEPPDVIVCDIDMPGMDGVEFIRHVAERRLASAILVASGLDTRVLQAVESVGEGYGLQVLGAVEKPLTARRLSDLLTRYRRPAPEHERVTATPAELRAALRDDRVHALFVPIVDLQVGAVSGAQAVATTQTGSGATARLVGEEVPTELAAALTDRVLGLACEQLHAITGAGLAFPLWIALPAETLADVAAADRLPRILRDHRVDPHQLVCAVDERAVRRSTPAELAVLTRLRVKGFGICLDGFGGGRMSDEALARIPLTAVALDPALVHGAAREPAQANALEDALESIRGRRLPAIARGCDDAAAYELLLQVGCRHAQGEFVAGALPATRLVDWARDWIAPAIAERSP